MRECRDDLNAVEFVVVVVIMHLEVVELHLILRHWICRLFYLSVKVLHYVPAIHRKFKCLHGLAPSQLTTKLQ